MEKVDQNAISHISMKDTNSSICENPFLCKPSELLFKDFTVGRKYTQKVLFTNISTSLQKCILQKFSENLVKCFTAEYEPKKRIPSGISIQMNVTFIPLEDKDLYGYIQMISSSGNFQIPILCQNTYEKITVSKQLIDFGKEPLGNAVVREITVCNSGRVPLSYVISSEYVDTSTDLSRLNHTNDIQDEGNKSKKAKDLGGFIVDGKRIGFLKPGCADVVSFKWEQQFVGPVSSDFVLSCPPCDDIRITCKAECISGSISVGASNVDFKTCLFGDSYQEVVTLMNRSSIAKEVKCTIPRELWKHIKVIPRKSLIQANSSFNFQVEFSPRAKLHLDAPMFFDSETSVLEAPILVQVSDEPELRVFILAVVTNDDVKISPSCVDFGVCTIYEKVCLPISLGNCSLLPQDISFVKLPPEILAQFHSTSGKLRPLESATVDLIFQPSRTCCYEFDLLLTNGRRKFPIKCRGVGKVPSLKLSHQVLVYKPTSPSDVSRHVLCISNETCEPRLFEFGTTDKIPIHIHPKVARLISREEALIEVLYRPRISEGDVKKEAFSFLKHDVEGDDDDDKADIGDAKAEESEELDRSPKVQFSASELIRARISLFVRLASEQCTFNIPCFVASEENGNLVQRLDETLFLQIHCQMRVPELVIISDDGSNVIDFGEVLVGLSSTKTIKIQNISNRDVQIRVSSLDPFGNFELLNAVKPIHSQETRNLRLRFAPTCQLKYYEEFSLNSGCTTLHMTLKGRGCEPLLVVSLGDGTCLDFGRVMVGEIVEEVVVIANKSRVAIRYEVDVDYIPEATRNALETFNCTPWSGDLETGASQEIRIAFRSNLRERQQCATCRISSSGRVLLAFPVKARTESHLFYISGLDHDVNVNLTLCPSMKEESEPIIVKVCTSKTENCFFIGCSRISTSSATRRSIDWTIECSSSLSELGFSINPIKGNVENRNLEKVNVSWNPVFTSKVANFQYFCKKSITIF